VRIVIATAGVLPPDPVADFVERLRGDEEDAVIVVTVVEVPRTFLDELRSEEWRPFDEEYSGEVAPDDAHVQTYVEERGRKLVEPVLSALRARGIEPQARFIEGGDAGSGIVEVAAETHADLIVMGATRKLFTESAWMSVSMQVTENSRLPVLLIPAPMKSAGEPTEDTPVIDGSIPGLDDS
jgi:nucleotide-binding universal stress UspA family protein